MTDHTELLARADRWLVTDGYGGAVALVTDLAAALRALVSSPDPVEGSSVIGEPDSDRPTDRAGLRRQGPSTPGDGWCGHGHQETV